MLLWFKDLMNVNEEVTMYKPNVSIHLSSAFIISFSWKFQIMSILKQAGERILFRHCGCEETG